MHRARGWPSSGRTFRPFPRRPLPPARRIHLSSSSWPPSAHSSALARCPSSCQTGCLLPGRRCRRRRPPCWRSERASFWRRCLVRRTKTYVTVYFYDCWWWCWAVRMLLMAEWKATDNWRVLIDCALRVCRFFWAKSLILSQSSLKRLSGSENDGGEPRRQLRNPSIWQQQMNGRWTFAKIVFWREGLLGDPPSEWRKEHGIISRSRSWQNNMHINFIYELVTHTVWQA